LLLSDSGIHQKTFDGKGGRFKARIHTPNHAEYAGSGLFHLKFTKNSANILF
jgi:hypothetical protein